MDATKIPFETFSKGIFWDNFLKMTVNDPVSGQRFYHQVNDSIIRSTTLSAVKT